MTILRLSINLSLFLLACPVFAFENSDSVHQHIIEVYEKKSQLLKSVDETVCHSHALEQESFLINKNLEEIKEQLSLSQFENITQMRQALYWYFHGRINIFETLTPKKLMLPHLSLINQLRKKNDLRFNEIIKKEKFLEKSHELLKVHQEDSLALYYKQLSLLDALEEEEKALKIILAERLKSENEEEQDTLESLDLAAFNKEALYAPLLNFQNRSKKDFMGAHIIEAKKGEEIHAIADGVVIFSDFLKGLGKMIIIEHTNKYLSLYANCEHTLFSSGHQVLEGQTIALVGNSGQIGSEGLYFELRQSGDLIALPEKWLP